MTKLKEFQYNQLGEGCLYSCLFRKFRGTNASLISTFSLLELFHNYFNLCNAVEGHKEDEWAISWYENMLKAIHKGNIGCRPEIKMYIKKWYISERRYENILNNAKKEFYQIFNSGIKTHLENMIEKAKNNFNENITLTN